MTNENLLTEAKMLELILIMSGQHNAAKVIDRLTEALRRAETERDAARETIKTLNRRAQQAEAGVRDNVEACKAAGVSMGRTLANAAAAMYLRRAEQAEAERDAQAKELARFKAVAALANSVVRWDSLLNEMHEQKARAQRAEQERDAQAALVATLTAERDVARAVKNGLHGIINHRERELSELTATRDLLTAENTRLQKERDEDRAELEHSRGNVWALMCLFTNEDNMGRHLKAVIKDLRAQVATLELLRRGGQ